jgi:hypothetical protein
MKVYIQIAFLAMCLSTGCAYFENRVRDLGDIVSADITVGLGMQAYTRATWLVGAGFGFGEFDRYGYRFGRFVHDKYAEHHMVDQDLTVCGVAPLIMFLDPWIFTIVGLPVVPRIFADSNDYENVFSPSITNNDSIETANGYMDISAALHIIYFGIEFRFKLNEFIDFIVGFTTIDLRGDDGGKNGITNVKSE